MNATNNALRSTLRRRRLIKTAWLLAWFAILLLLPVSLAGARWFLAGFAPRMQERVEQEIPLGSSRARVKSWVQANQLGYGVIPHTHRIRRQGTKITYIPTLTWDITLRHYQWSALRISTSLMLSFEKDKLTNAEVRDDSTCDWWN